MNILVHAYNISPKRGSEFSVSWNYVAEMSKFHHLYVIVGSTTHEPYDYSELEGVNLKNVDFIFPELDKRFGHIYKLYKKLLEPAIGRWTFYLPLYFWNKSIYRKVKIDKDLLSKIDIIHFISPVGWHEIGYLYKLGKPCIWGPVGGFTNWRREFYTHYSYIKKKIVLKNFLNSFFALTSKHLRSAMKKYDLVIANTHDTERFISSHYKTRNLLYFPENSMRIKETEIKNLKVVQKKYDGLMEGLARGERVECIWCGTLEERKMPHLLCDAVRLMKNKNKLHINIVGGGTCIAS